MLALTAPITCAASSSAHGLSPKDTDGSGEGGVGVGVGEVTLDDLIEHTTKLYELLYQDQKILD